MAREFKRPDYTYRAIVDRVIDGDTIDVHLDVGFNTTIFKRLRFLELDTEEMRSSELERREKAHAAKKRVEEILANADKVYVQTVLDSKGKYGRVLAYVWVENDGTLTNLNEQMVLEGFEKVRE